MNAQQNANYAFNKARLKVEYGLSDAKADELLEFMQENLSEEIKRVA